MKEGSVAKLDGPVGLAALVHQKGKGDPGVLAKMFGMGEISQANSGEAGSSLPEGSFLLAQLRDVFPAENSAVVAKEDDHGRSLRPQRPQAYGAAIRVKQGDFRQLAAEGIGHGSFSNGGSAGVKLRGNKVYLWFDEGGTTSVTSKPIQ
jgi:hypothetical protein